MVSSGAVPVSSVTSQVGVARDAIAKGTSGDYLVALSSVPRTPGWMRRIGMKPMSLGLDLRGGVHFVYEVDIQGALAQTVERMERDVRTTLRDKRTDSPTFRRLADELTGA